MKVEVVTKVPVRAYHTSSVSPPLHAGVAHVQSHLQNVLDDALVQLLRLVTGRFHVTHVVSGSHVQLVRVPDEGVQSAGVTREGLVALTGAQLHVAVVHTGKADAPHQTRTSVVAQLARVCCDQVAVVPVAISEYAVAPVLLPVPQSVTATSVHPGA